MKKCSKCKTFKDPSCFNRDKSRGEGLCFRCKSCDAEYRKNNRARLSEINRAWRAKRDQEERRAYSRRYWRDRKQSDAAYAITHRLRNRVKMAFSRGTKSARFWDLTGCTLAELLEHIESKFTDGMSWDNRSEWHVDHIMPCASFDLTDPAQQRRCFHYTNLQPLWARDNLAKGARIPHQEQAA